MAPPTLESLLPQEKMAPPPAANVNRSLLVDTLTLEHQFSMLQLQTEKLNGDIEKMQSDLEALPYGSSGDHHFSMLQLQTEHLKSDLEKVRSESSSLIHERHFSMLQLQAENLKHHLETSSSLIEEPHLSMLQYQTEKLRSDIENIHTDFSCHCRLRDELVNRQNADQNADQRIEVTRAELESLKLSRAEFESLKKERRLSRAELQSLKGGLLVASCGCFLLFASPLVLRYYNKLTS